MKSDRERLNRCVGLAKQANSRTQQWRPLDYPAGSFCEVGQSVCVLLESVAVTRHLVMSVVRVEALVRFGGGALIDVELFDLPASELGGLSTCDARRLPTSAERFASLDFEACRLWLNLRPLAPRFPWHCLSEVWCPAVLTSQTNAGSPASPLRLLKIELEGAGR